MVEEARGTMAAEGFEQFIGRDPAGGLRRGVALAPKIVSGAISEHSKDTEILKQRRKAREEKVLAAAGAGNKKKEQKGGGKGGQGSHP